MTWRTRHPAASGLGMPRGPASHARGVSRRGSAPWEAGFADAGGTGLWARYPFPDSQTGRARFFQRNIRLEKERKSLPNENTVGERQFRPDFIKSSRSQV